MDLKNAINNTNAQKENIKTVANNIDNKLIELGGERATDLADVPNKIQNVKTMYKKTATGGDIAIPDHVNWSGKIKINLTFKPSVVYVFLKNLGEPGNQNKQNVIVCSKNNYSKETGVGSFQDATVWIENFTQTEIIVGYYWFSYTPPRSVSWFALE